MGTWLALLVLAVIASTSARHIARQKRNTVDCFGSETCVNGECRQTGLGTICVCNPGFSGPLCDQPACLCSIVGNKYYRAFGGEEVLGFYGTCRYKLTGNCDDLNFWIDSENQYVVNAVRTKYIEMFIFGKLIRLSYPGVVTVDGVLINSLPHFVTVGSDHIYIVRLANNDIQVITSTMVKIRYDGDNFGEIELPPSYYEKTCGLCGKCSVHALPVVMSDGQLPDPALPKPQRDAAIGNSWKVGGPADCVADTGSGLAACEAAAQQDAEAKCAKADLMIGCSPAIIGQYKAICISDVCHADAADRNEVACGILGALRKACADDGTNIEYWRSLTNCEDVGLVCDSSETYQDSDYACQASCSSIDQQECPVTDMEGCSCNGNLIESDGQCTNASNCGCNDAVGYHENGEEWFSSDCTTKYSCSSGTISSTSMPACVAPQECVADINGVLGCNDVPPPYNRDNCVGIICENGGSCISQHNAYVCDCPQGYVGTHCETPIDYCTQDSVVCQNGGTCRNTPQGAVCDCKPGFSGDRCQDSSACQCHIYGDPSIVTFDGALMNFHGTCKYSYSTLCENSQPGLEFFKVYVRHFNRLNTNPKTAFPEFVHLEYRNHTVRLQRAAGGGVEILANRVKRDLPTYLHNNGVADISIEYLPDGKVRAKAANGIEIYFDGEAKAIISVPNTYAGNGNLCGVCGDCNGIKADDYKAKDGFIKIGDDRVNKIITSFFEPDEQIFSCEHGLAIDGFQCVNDQARDFASAADMCGVITDANGPLGGCIASMDPALISEIYDACVEDACKMYSLRDEPSAREAKCVMVELLIKRCAQPPADFRALTSCPLDCGINKSYKVSGTACPNTCAKPDAESSCTEANVEGCYCDGNALLSNQTCIDISNNHHDCGCADPNDLYSYRAKNTEYFSDGCEDRWKCHGRLSIPPIIDLEWTWPGMLTKEGGTCDINAECTVTGKQLTCACMHGFTGDGIHCEEVNLCKVVYRDGKTPQELCEPNGVCNNLVGDWVCQCQPGWTKPPGGEFCTVDINECENITCSNRGNCSQVGAGYVCTCDEGFTGQDCETNIDDCIPDPCVHGTCIDGDNDYTCACENGWIGKNCDINEDDCSPNPCQNGGICNDLVADYRCDCINGYVGRNCEIRPPCHCTAAGDPHYNTHDNQWIHFMGTCKYVLSQLCPDSQAGLVDYKVYVQNEDRINGSMRVSWTKSVEVEAYGHNILIDKGLVLSYTAAGQPWISISSLPKYLAGGKIAIKYDVTGSVRVEVELGQPGDGTILLVKFDGDDVADVYAPDSYRDEMCGICGDCNGVQDDLRLSDGTDVSQLPPKEAYAEIGNSYKVQDGQVCRDGTPQDGETCTGANEDIARGIDYCGYLLDIHSDNIFKACYDSNMLPPGYLESALMGCTTDVCERLETDPDTAKEASCKILESTAELCRGINHPVTYWRNATNCPLECGPDMAYVPLGTACPNTCADPTAASTCTLEDTEGCHCAEGMLLSSDECVLPENCGCVDADGSYHKLDSSWLSDDCNTMFTCVKAPDGTKQVESEAYGCDQAATCDVVNGEKNCVCTPPMIGDGKTCNQPGCPLPMEIQNGYHDYSGTPVVVPIGTKVNYTCHGGNYMPGGASNDMITCQNNGTYDKDPAECSPGCPHPMDGTNALHDYTNGLPVTVGTNVTYTCNAGNLMSDGTTIKTIKCLQTGLYDSGPANCQPGCPIPMEIQNGYHDYSGIPVVVPIGTKVNYTCHGGNFMPGGASNDMITCQNNGTYDKDPAECSPGCPHPMNGTNAVHDYTNGLPVTVGTNVTYTCNAGNLMDDGTTIKTIKCLQTGLYDSGPANCQPGCLLPMKIQNGDHDYPGGIPVPPDTQVKYECHGGNFMPGGATTDMITCQKDGTYDKDPAECSPGCPHPMNGTNAIHDYTNGLPVAVGTNVTYICNAGNLMDDGTTIKTIKCLQTGLYDSGPANCQPGCPIPMDGENRQHNYQGDGSVDVGTFITFTCKKPFFDASGVKEKTIECLPDGTYDDTPPQCDQPGCDLPMDGSRASNNYPGVSAPVDIDTQVTYTCNSGYTMADGSTTKTITCLDTGNYDSGPAMCDTQPGCPIPMDDDVNRQHNYQGDDPVPVGTFITFTCKKPFFDASGVKEKTIECLPDGTYDDTPPQCDQPGCDLPMDGSRASNNYPGVSAPVDIDTQVTYTCNSGYTMADGSTTKTITCLDTGNYDSGPAMCDTQPGCPIPMDDDVNRQHNYQGEDPVPVGTFITFTCRMPFFDVSGVKEKTIECLPDGTYDDTPPQCDQPGCDLPMDGSRASNNYPGVSAPVDFGTKVIYTCNSGYTMADGSTTKTITCLDAGNYDSGPAMCDTPTVSNYCRDCIYLRNGPGYYEDPNDCGRFVQCLQDIDGNIVTVSSACPGNLLWSQSELTCVSCDKATCVGVIGGKPDCEENGKCETGYYSDPTNCAAYYQCSPAGAVRMCCPGNTMWGGSGCIFRDASCTDVCSTPVTPTVAPPTLPPHTLGDTCYDADGRKKRAVVGDSYVYALYVAGGNEYVLYPCTPYEFSLAACDCVVDQSGLPPACRFPNNIGCFPFDVDYKDQSGHISWLDKGSTFIQQDDAVHGGAVQFDGNTDIEIPAFSNSDLGSEFSVCVWFKYTAGDSDDRMRGIVNNGDCDNEPSYNIRIDGGISGSVGAGVISTGSHQRKAYEDILTAKNEWHHTCLVKEVDKVLFYLDGVSQGIANNDAIGDLISNPVPMILGRTIYCELNENAHSFFIGKMDELVIFKSALSQADVLAVKDGFN
ncbi:zonadhesin isoform X2 [Lingula anatina]|uniref:Zonadhesin isoform X2 n=1 Tax=Lingula anatina TaxID=7574 RepID=A0A2R2MPN4_LINAN|nr:zonadhesin isoform X2 [Lingula anatina]|eukprot:XP_023932138.1 zonadhesin isoform X2 [Lingula anatina]